MWSDASNLYHVQELNGDRKTEVLRGLQSIIFKGPQASGRHRAVYHRATVSNHPITFIHRPDNVCYQLWLHRAYSCSTQDYGMTRVLASIDE